VNSPNTPAELHTALHRAIKLLQTLHHSRPSQMQFNIKQVHPLRLSPTATNFTTLYTSHLVHQHPIVTASQQSSTSPSCKYTAVPYPLPPHPILLTKQKSFPSTYQFHHSTAHQPSKTLPQSTKSPPAIPSYAY